MLWASRAIGEVSQPTYRLSQSSREIKGLCTVDRLIEFTLATLVQTVGKAGKANGHAVVENDEIDIETFARMSEMKTPGFVFVFVCM